MSISNKWEPFIVNTKFNIHLNQFKKPKTWAAFYMSSNIYSVLMESHIFKIVAQKNYSNSVFTTVTKKNYNID